MSTRHSDRASPKIQRLRNIICELSTISLQVNILLIFLREILEDVDIYEEALESIESFQCEISWSSRKLSSTMKKCNNPDDIFKNMSKGSIQKLTFDVMQCCLDAMATSDSMYQSFRQNDGPNAANASSHDELIGGIWGIMFLFAGNVAGKLCQIDELYKRSPKT